MKRMKKNGLWYNDRSKEIGGIILDSRGAAARCGGPYTDARAGLRFLGVQSQGWAAAR